jgi:hypothetical protein
MLNRPTWFEIFASGASAPLKALAGGGRHALHWASAHTGLPVVVVAAIALVLSWRLAKRTARLVVEVAVALAVLLIATKLGLIRW